MTNAKKMSLELNKEMYLQELEKNGMFSSKVKSIQIRKLPNSSMFLEISQYYLIIFISKKKLSEYSF
jgi:hypothetical protein